MDDTGGKSDYVTQIISRKVKPERQGEYETWLRERLTPALASFDGYEGITVLRPAQTASGEYVIIQRWRDYDRLCDWAGSDLRREAHERRAGPRQALPAG